MNEHERLGDPAFDRLAAADPAKRAPEPVQGVLRAKVDALIAEQTEQGPAGGAERGTARRESAGSAEPTEPASRERADELALRRHRRRAPWLVAAAVAGIVAAGGGGYVAGESGLGFSPTADTAAESTTEQAPSVMGEPEGADTEGDAEPGAEDATEDDSAAATGGVQPLHATGDLPTATGVVFHAGAALSDRPTTAEVRVAGAGGESLGSYPVVSEVEAVDRLGDPRFAGAVLGWSRQGSAQDEAGPPATRTTPAPGGPVAWPVEDVTIVSAALTEARYTLSDGAVLLVPAYDLTDEDGSRWTVMAVDEELLDFAP
ncbi:hypothetical protein [Promicromonospora panici]|uniref:hypothetical protein n=1 Tax=Promicromonospora panici TaxID=2219658 RepID=UPI00101C8FD0|nr:hypothetical protein [Promicromonospora panici]